MAHMASQDELDRVGTTADKLNEEYEVLSTLTEQLLGQGQADEPGVALTLSQAKRTQRCTQQLVRALAALRDVT